MTVEELIERLSAFDPHEEVSLRISDEWGSDLETIEYVGRRMDTGGVYVSWWDES